MLNNILDFLTTAGSILFWFIIILIPLVIIHEFGHFLAARMFGIKVVEFGVGIPPRAAYKIKKGVVWSLNWLPLGGFAKIYGDHDAIDEANENNKKGDRNLTVAQYQNDRILELISGKELETFLLENSLDYDKEWTNFEKAFTAVKYDSDKLGETNTRLFNQLNTLIEWEMDAKLSSTVTFYSKSYWKKAVVLLGGVTFNLITAVVLFAGLTGFSHISRGYDLNEGSDLKDIRKDYSDNITSDKARIFVAEDGQADKNGVKPGDELISINGKSPESIKSLDQYKDLVQKSKDSALVVVYKQDGEEKTTRIHPEWNEDRNTYLSGMYYGYVVEYESTGFWNSIGLGWDQTGYVFSKTWEGLGQMVAALAPGEDKSILKEAHGPIGIGDFGSDAYEQGGVRAIIILMAVISVALALFNLLPIPALDGGRLLILTINKFTGRRNKKVEGIIIGLTFILLIGLQIAITWNDISWISGK